MTFGGAALSFLAFFTWVRIEAPAAAFFVSAPGTSNQGRLWIIEQGDGWPNVVLGVSLVVAGLFAFVSPSSTSAKTVGVVASALSVCWLMVVHFHSNAEFDRTLDQLSAVPSTRNARAIFSMEFGAGYWLSFAAGTAALFGAIVLHPSEK
jgi:hypothetical protein